MDEELLFNPFLPEFHADPYPAYHRLRERAPVYRMPLGFYVVTRYDDVVTVLRDPRFGRAGFEPLLASVYGEPGQDAMPSSMLFRDPPDHTRLRALVSRAFTPRVVEAMRPRIQGIVDGLLDRAEKSGGMEVIADLAYPLPVRVICEMLGVPLEDQESIKQWSSDVARALDTIGLPGDDEVMQRGRAGRAALGRYFHGLLPERRARPRDDLLSLLIAAEEQGDRLSEGELLATCVLLFIAGHETTVNLIGNGLLALLRHPVEADRLRADPALLPAGIEELLRFDSPVQRTARIANAEVEIGGQAMPPGTMVIAAIGAANRDPAHFPDPDRLDVGRADNRHVAFGFGIHYCLGAPLARVEGQIAIGSLLRRFPKLAMASGPPDWRESSTLRGLRALPVTFG
jgi:cytochrome P450